MSTMRICIPILLCLAIVLNLHAQQDARSLFEKAASLRMARLNNKTIFNLSIQPEWNADSAGFTYVLQNRDGKKFMHFDVKSRKIAPVVDHARLAQLVSTLLKKNIGVKDLPVTALRVKDKNHLTAIIDGRTYTIDRNNY